MLPARNALSAIPEVLEKKIKANSSHTWWFAIMFMAALHENHYFTSEFCPIVSTTVIDGINESKSYIYGEGKVQGVKNSHVSTIKDCIENLPNHQEYLIVFVDIWLRVAVKSEDVVTIAEFLRLKLKGSPLEHCLDLIEMRCKLSCLYLEKSAVERGQPLSQASEVIDFLKTHRASFFNGGFGQTRSIRIYNLLKKGVANIEAADREITTLESHFEYESEKKFSGLTLPKEKGRFIYVGQVHIKPTPKAESLVNTP